MIEMQMRQQDVRDVAGLHAQRLETVRQPALLMVEDLALDRAQPVADSGIDQDRLVHLA